MSLSLLQAFLEWVSQNAIWSGLIIFLIACSESLALVGLLVPGAVLMFALGTLIATGHLEFWPAVSWAAAGAIAGDGLSYWLGYYYHDRLAKLWPLSRHPELLDSGRVFFEKHGGKSVLFGRFIGPLRPIVPAIAGMAGMPLSRFFIINILSGIAWAPLYLLPGMAFGLSLTLAGEVAGRLVVAILLLLVLIFIALWLAKRLYNAFLPRIDNILFSIARWSRQHPVAGHIPDALIKPEHPEVRVLSLLAILLFLASSLFIAILQLTGESGLLYQLNKLLQSNLTALHNPLFDSLMLSISNWTGKPVQLLMLSISNWTGLPGIMLISLLSIAWLLGQHNRFAIWHLLAVIFVTWLLGLGLPMLFDEAGTRLPSSSIMVFTALTGFLAVTLARETSIGYHRLVYLVAAGIIFLAGFARIYLQQNAFSEVLGGMMLGSCWLAIVGIAYRRHVHLPYVKTQAVVLFVAIQFICLVLIIPSFPGEKLQQPEVKSVELALADWHSQDWKQLSLLRKDIRFQQNHPLNLQWAGQLESIRQQLQQLGWQVAPSAGSLHLLQWFNPSPDDRALPLLPQVHDGQYDELRMVRYSQQAPEYLRLWKTGVRIKHSGQTRPLWLGSVGQLYRQKIMGLTLFRTSTEYRQTPAHFIQAFKHHPSITVRPRSFRPDNQDVTVFLIDHR